MKINVNPETKKIQISMTSGSVSINDTLKVDAARILAKTLFSLVDIVHTHQKKSGGTFIG